MSQGGSRALAAELTRKARVKEPKGDAMFLNVAHGAKDGLTLARAKAELIELGLPCTVTPGPLLMKTVGKTGGAENDSLWIAMPILPTSTYAFLHKTIDIAYERIRSRGGGQDMALGGERSVPHFAHGTWRRMADTAAQAAFARGECTAEDIDLHFGWKLKKYQKTMRLHYAGRGARCSRARLTQWI